MARSKKKAYQSPKSPAASLAPRAYTRDQKANSKISRSTWVFRKRRRSRVSRFKNSAPVSIKNTGTPPRIMVLMRLSGIKAGASRGQLWYRAALVWIKRTMMQAVRRHRSSSVRLMVLFFLF